MVSGEQGDLAILSGLIDSNENILLPFEYDIITFEGNDSIKTWLWTGKSEVVPDDLVVGGTKTVSTFDVNIIPISDLLKNKPKMSDVPRSMWCFDAVQWAVENGIASGTNATTFSPDSTCSKAQILTFLWRANGLPEPTAANPFTDVKTTDYFYKAALWAAEQGLVSSSTFGANTDCTRAMTMEYMWKAAGSPATSSKASFTDVPANADYAQAVAWAVEKGVTAGTSKTTFSPSSTCTRGQIVTFLHRAMWK